MAEVLEQYGPYTRVRRLGAGGMAETFLAVQRGAAGFEQRVCMKFILPGYRDDSEFRRLFLREATIAASLRHSNIVGVIDVDDVAGYLVLELVDGVDLRALLNAAPNHRLPAALTTLIAIELCKALAYAHGRMRGGQADGIVHRDVSASNVLISYAGEVKLTDFGVARAMRSDAEPLSATVKGKLCYMSPEQARGQPLDGRSDLFSLGVLCYELLSGRRPFDAPTDAETLLRITAGQHTPLIELAPDVPGGLAMVVERLLCRDREQRFASADQCIDALARFAASATAFRELGDLARAARPHETLPSYEPRAAERVAPRDPYRGAPYTQTLPAPRELQAPRDAVRSEPQVDARPSAGRSAPRVNGNAWLALGGSLLVLLAVASAWVARLQSAPEQTVVQPATHAARPSPRDALAQAGNNGMTIALAEPQPSGDTEPPTETDEVREDLSPPAPEHQERSQPTPHAPPTDAEEGTLRIGTMPIGQVWVDGRAVGWAPVTVKLHAGMHTVEGGITQPELRRSVRIRAGANRQYLLNLDQAK